MAIILHEANFDEIRNLVLKISSRIEFDNVKTVVTQDHYFIWAWVSEVLLSRYVYVYQCDSHDSNLLDLCCRAALANTNVICKDDREWSRKIAYENATPHFIKGFQKHSFLTLGYLVFPLLEGIIKQKSTEYITSDGKVLKEFSVPSRRNPYKVGSRCSSLRDLLFLFHEQICDEELKSDIDFIRNSINEIDDSSDAFNVVYQWRNDSLHGFANHQHVAVTLFSLCLIILLHSIKGKYDDIKGNIANESALGLRRYASHTFYPPY